MKSFLCVILFSASLWALDLNEIRNERNLEKRAHLAMQHAAESFNEAKLSYADGNTARAAQLFQEMQDSVELAHEALNETGKDPRRHPHPFKLAETETRNLLRKIDGMENSMRLEDQKIIEEPKMKMQEVHDEWLNGIISGRR